VQIRQEHLEFGDLKDIWNVHGSRGGFTPFVIESTGRLGPAAHKFLTEIGQGKSYYISQLYTALSALSALYNSLMLKGASAR
jgi:hypothetical protein